MHQRKPQRTQTSIRVLQAGVLGLSLLIFGRLVQLQIFDYDKYVPLSKENSLRQETIPAARGLIMDRYGKLIVDNEPIYSISITPANYDKENTPILADLMGIPDSVITKRVQEATDYSWYRSSRLFTEIDFQTFSAIEENIWRLPGISHQIESKRHYPIDSMKASHLLGYLREVSEEQYQQAENYHLGDKVGKSGLEVAYENHLRGTAGTKYIKVNAMGQSLGPYDNGALDIAPTKGSDLYTTIDTELQVLAEDLMEGKQGSMVALNPNDGSVLAMVSAPQYDIRRLSGRIDIEYWQSINADTLNPLYNRAISGRQPPGSTFKPLMAMMGLEMNLINPETEINNPGYYYRGRRYNDLADPGQYNVTKALEKSSNTFFFWLMDQMVTKRSINEWNRLASGFGMGKLDGIDLPNESKGILPDSSYMNRVLGENRWGVGDLLNLGIGQGFISVSPLQMALVTSSIANGGYSVQPHIVKAIQNSDGSIQQTKSRKEKIGWVTNNQIQIAKEGMRLVVKNGSGRFYADLDSVKVAGKTGTAQNPQGIDHGWFIAFAPMDDPQIAVAVLIENGGFGSISAAPVASLIIEKYLTGEINRSYVYNLVKNFEPREANSQSNNPPDSTDINTESQEVNNE